jgi:opacity protein-like surface antigen
MLANSTLVLARREGDVKYFLPLVLAVSVGISATFSPTVRADWTLILKGGSFRLSDDSQTLSGGITLSFDEDASSVFGIEGEWRLNDNVALGGEYFTYSNDWVSILGTSGEIDTGVLMFNVKRYFNTAKRIQPYIGAGIGFAALDFKGPGGRGTGSDLALQAMGGVAVRWQRIGLYTEVKWLSSEPEDDVGDKIDVSGVGLFAGLSIHF